MRRSRDEKMSGQLYYLTIVRILKSFFKKYSRCLGSSLGDGSVSVVIGQKLQFGHIRAHRFKITLINTASLELIMLRHQMLVGHYWYWTYKIFTDKSGDFTLLIRNMTITIGRIFPVQCDSLLFIDPKINWKANVVFDSFQQLPCGDVIYTVGDLIVRFRESLVMERSSFDLNFSFWGGLFLCVGYGIVIGNLAAVISII
uniref:Uncharacterized protein n=1 Tax=Onchocerca volvulus TaxID=6282 RepID=A0A8R1XZB5_ONCVO